MTVHRATLKHKQKGFKSAHKSKGAIKAANKGRIAKDGSGPKAKTVTKQDRKNMNNQVKAAKKLESADKIKIFEGKDAVPRNIAIIPLGPDVDSAAVAETLRASVEGVNDPNVPGVIDIPRFCQKLRFFAPSYNAFSDLLDAARAADFCLYVLSAANEAGDYGEQIVRCIGAQASTTSVGVIYNLEHAGNQKAQAQARDSLTSWFGHFFSEFDKLYSLQNVNETLNAIRFIVQKAPKGISWRDERPYIVAEKLEATNEGLIVQGLVRGQDLNPDQLVHIPGVGDVQISKLEEVPRHDRGMDVDSKVWQPTSEQESLDVLAEDAIEMNEPDVDERVDGAGIRVDGHYYVHDMIDAEFGDGGPRNIKKIPKGMSDYQASWLLEGEDYGFEEDEFDNPDEDEVLTDEEGELVPDNDEGMEMDDDDEEDEQIDEQDDDNDMEELSPEEEERQLKEFREKAKEDAEFPDEIELNPNESAVERFNRYRGVRSLRTCEWDANESDPRAPEEWTRLSKPGNIVATKNFIQKQTYEGATVGTRVIAYLPLVNGISAEQANQMVEQTSRGVPVTLYGLLRYEHKTSLLNMSIALDSEYTSPLASKQAIVAQYGPRRMIIRPLYSQPGSGDGNNVYKYFRYLQPGRSAMATVLAPPMLGHVPIVYYSNSSTPQLIGTGTIENTDTSRVIVKTAVITGHPLKIHKKLVTVRYMFFNPKDVAWFKSVPLFTKSGRSGYIKESLGTHGYFKATFDGKIDPADSIAMALYKRVWPRNSEPSAW